jgi:hypothetical protein
MTNRWSRVMLPTWTLAVLIGINAMHLIGVVSTPAFGYEIATGESITMGRLVEKGKPEGARPFGPLPAGPNTGASPTVLAIDASPGGPNGNSVSFRLNAGYPEFRFKGLLPSHTVALGPYPCDVKASIRPAKEIRGSEGFASTPLGPFLPTHGVDVRGSKAFVISGNFAFRGDVVLDVAYRDRVYQPVAVNPKGDQKEWLPLLWSDGAVHEFPEKVSFAGYDFQPDRDAKLVFRVVADKGYVFEEGKGKVRSPNRKTIELNDSKRGLVFGEPSKRNP